MKFLTCSQCLTAEQQQQQQQQQQMMIREVTNPLVVKKKKKKKKRGGSSSSSRKNQQESQEQGTFPGNLFSSLWRRRRRHQQPLAPPAQSSRRHARTLPVYASSPQLVSAGQCPTTRTTTTSRVEQHAMRLRPATRTQRLIKMYEERANSRSFEDLVIDPPACFSGGSLESHQNFKNKLNTLDFRRMNTVALEPQPHAELLYAKKNRYEPECYQTNTAAAAAAAVGAIPIGKFAKKTLLVDDLVNERTRIEQTMIDLLDGEDLQRTDDDDDDECITAAAAGKAANKELRVDMTGEKKNLEVTEDGRVEQNTEITLSVDPLTKVEDFYIERKTTFLKDKTVEDKALVLKIAPIHRQPPELKESSSGTTAASRDGMIDHGPRQFVLRNFGKLKL